NRLRDAIQVLRRLGVVLGHEAVSADDAALRVLAAAAQVVFASLAVGTGATRPAHGRDDEVTGLPPLDLLSHLLDDAEVLVAENQELLAVRRLAVEALIDLRVVAAQADTQHFHSHLIRLQRRIRHVAHVDAVPLARFDDDGTHGAVSSQLSADSYLKSV